MWVLTCVCGLVFVLGWLCAFVAVYDSSCSHTRARTSTHLELLSVVLISVAVLVLALVSVATSVLALAVPVVVGFMASSPSTLTSLMSPDASSFLPPGVCECVIGVCAHSRACACYVQFMHTGTLCVGAYEVTYVYVYRLSCPSCFVSETSVGRQLRPPRCFYCQS